MNELLPLIIDTLQDQSSTSKREVALHTLGLLAKSTGYVVTPFLRNPALLDIFLNLIKTERAPLIRREVVKVLGIIGAVDPYKHKLNQLVGREEKVAIGDDKGGVGAGGAGGGSGEMPTISTTSEDYYPTVAIAALMKILRDHTLSAHHTMVIQAVMYIFKSLNMKCIPFLPQIMPPFLHVMNTCETGFREFLFQQMGALVSIVKQRIQKW
jgi:serine/threonine-protein kinase mTOR